MQEEFFEKQKLNFVKVTHCLLPDCLLCPFSRNSYDCCKHNLQRLAALVPGPPLHLIRFHGVLAPNAKLRPEIIPSSGRQAGNVPVPRFPSAPVNVNTPSADHAEVPPPAAPAPMSWARLLKRVFEIDINSPLSFWEFNEVVAREAVDAVVAA